MVSRLCAVLLVFTCVGAAPADKAQEQYRLEREDLLRNDNTLVVKLSVRVPKVKAAEMAKLVFRWRDKTSHSISKGMWEQTETERRAVIVIVAQVTRGTGDHPPMLMLSTGQTSQGVAQTFEAHRLTADAKVSDLISIDVKDGQYALCEKLRIGVVGGEPMHLSFEPFPTR